MKQSTRPPPYRPTGSTISTSQYYQGIAELNESYGNLAKPITLLP